ncbi:MAG TPA: hypothetical protein QGF58_05230 [Myxococcota bacterium]|nr:hypothetical protein [Myxococcota bacterium]
MAGTTEVLAPTTHGAFSIALPGRTIARDVVAYAAGFTASFAWAAGLGFVDSHPELSFAGSLALGLVASVPRKILWTPIALAAGIGMAWLAAPLGVPSVVLAGAAVGLVAAWIRGLDQGRLDLLNGALSGAIAAAVAGTVFVLGLLGDIHPVANFALVGLAASLSLAPTWFRFKARSEVPSRKKVELTLEPPYRKPVLRALELHGQLRAAKPPEEMMEGLHEVVGWVYRLAQSLQTLGRDVEALDEEKLIERVELLQMEADETEDEFLRDRRYATAEHLRKLLQHAQQLRLEQERTASLQEYAIAYLEEARLGLTLARALPGEQAPVRLNEVLDKLRGHAREGDVRRRTAREVGLS